ncbi:hypothetical protein ACFL3G_10775 [Planctomycetota bacterium]
MSSSGFAGKLKWYLTVFYIVLIGIMLATFFTDIFATSGQIPQIVWLILGLMLLFAVTTIIAKTVNLLDTLERNGTKLEKLAEAQEKSRLELTQISQNIRLSETAKTIAFRDSDRQTLREAVFDKLQQQDFDSAYNIIDEISSYGIYSKLVEQLRFQADKYRDATDTERINQVIEHIEKLFETYQWTKASSLIERLVNAHPANEQAKAMRQRLLDKKQDRKKVLLNAWDDAVKRRATDRSLEILRELDQYLTPNEGLALQEAARDIFRNKLHNLGVQFSIAVSGRRWSKAIEAGQQIMRDFPNSKMAGEIREKMVVLKQMAQQ